LTWTSQAAEHVSIDQGIGNVAVNGSMVVAPQSDTLYTITAAGPGGTATQSVMVAVRSPIRIDILSPADGATVERPDIMVYGTIANTTGKETGITVNGKVAMIHGNRFVVNHVPLQEGMNTITATATDTGGNSHSVDTIVNAVMPEHHISLQTNRESGSAPLEMSLSIDGTFSIQDAILSHTGIEPDELIEVAADEYQAAFNQEGIAFLTAEATHDTSTYRDTIGVLVLDRTSIDTLLRQKWEDMKSHLANKDIARAVTNFDENKKGLYEKVFSVLLDRLPQIANDMQDLSLVSIEHQSAKYRIRRIETHNTGTFEVTYYVYFITDENGIWRIYRF
jgi:hypothetical protein